MNTTELLSLSRPELAQQLALGHAIDPAALDDSEYRGVSLGLPRFIERLTWKVFKKAFHRDGKTGRLRGWNVRLEQDGIDAPARDMLQGGRRVTFGHFEVRAADHGEPRDVSQSLVLDYALGKNARLDPTAIVLDYLVAVEPGNAELLLGRLALDLRAARINTPSYFILERDAPLAELASPARPLQ